MKKNEEITNLSEEIMFDITDGRLPLNNILLKCCRLSLLVDLPKNVELFKQWSVYAELNQFVVGSYAVSIEAAKDPNVSVSSANENEHVTWGIKNNAIERTNIRKNTEQVVEYLSKYRTEAYNFALNIYSKWRFGNIAETIFERKRHLTEPILREIFPDISQRLNSIENNLRSDNSEDWKSAAVSCRTLLIDIADTLNPNTEHSDVNYINRLKDYISPKIESETKKKLLKTYLEEVKDRIEYVSNLTQGPAHMRRPTKTDSENVVLYTYLIIAELMEAHQDKNAKIEITLNDEPTL